MEEAAWSRTVDHSPRDGQVIAATVWGSDTCESAVGSAEGGEQVTGEAQCVCFAQQDVNGEVEQLRECTGVHIEDSELYE
jgi:hypothetical protein